MMDFTLRDDTICAIATPIGEGGIGIIKISGPEAFVLARKLFHPFRPVVSFESHRLYHGWIKDPLSGDAVDEVLLSCMAAPRTYTREDLVEINCHSGYAVLERMLGLVLAAGARLADPGEFTKRAFLNGRIDLSQAEAVSEIIHSRSQQGLLLAARNLGGEFRQRVLLWKETLLRLQAGLEAHIDFADDLEEDSSAPLLDAAVLEAELLQPIAYALDQYRTGRVLREGLTMVLIGRPNVGKSSLLNALLGKDRAIVTPFPGATRDVIEDCFMLSGILVRILDTAGIRRNPDEIESMGIERTFRSVEEADLVLWLIDRSSPLTDEDETVFHSISGAQRLILLNKSDLEPAVSPSEVENRFGTDAPILSISALVPSDVDRLRDWLSETFLRQPIERSRSAIIPNLRQKECLERAMESLSRTRDLLASGAYGELLSFELASARRSLEGILGGEGDDELLDRIFSEFCIGK